MYVAGINCLNSEASLLFLADQNWQEEVTVEKVLKAKKCRKQNLLNGNYFHSVEDNGATDFEMTVRWQ